jgi:hypothetical protein
LALLLTGVYPFVSSNVNFAQSQQMMPTAMPTTPQTSTPAPNNNQTITILIVAIAIVAIALIAAVLILMYLRKQKREATHTQAPHVYTSRRSQILPTIPQKTTSKDEGKPFEVFLCYKKSSGKDYADHLKSGLEEVGLHTFEDCKDIPQTVNTEEGWSRIRDKALTESRYFILIMTPGFDLSSEVVKELAIARKLPNKTFVFFRHRSMGRKIRVDLGGEVLDIGELEQVSFESKEELLRQSINILQRQDTLTHRNEYL